MFFGAAFIMGLLGSLHCIGMCGPIAVAVPFRTRSSKMRFAAAALYNSGRVISYGVIGFLFGLLGYGLSLAGLQQWLSIAAGLVLIISFAVAYFGGGAQRLIANFNWFPLPLKNAMSSILRGNKLSFQVLLGMLNGLLPCGLVYMAVAGAIATGTSWNGALFMMYFGLGTTPAMFALPFAMNRFAGEGKIWLRKFVPAFLLVIGMLFVVRGLNLGIPYISPKISYEVSAGNGCHN